MSILLTSHSVSKSVLHEVPFLEVKIFKILTSLGQKLTIDKNVYRY